ncbi:calcium-binding protein [Oscillatoria sp. FACHB-1407]|uniref:calcium-binding protein n=1 Tax=Oscillatoria sp. FACHB-1407 TaxID=2692847 RepID=UPI0016867830|nr:calcium-binding protein [Oscillatoria sp. FACHB-1407]MBD2461975.1 calcium-binding protein [Oscillatoria sp. FACHB-1407]
MAYITGTDGKDLLIGGIESDTILAKGGNDEIFANGGDDDIDAGDGDDYVVAGDGNDNVLGALGNDFLLGGAGDDKLIGMEGNDSLVGGAGNDRMDGGFGNDTYSVDSVGDAVIEQSPNGGIDSVNSYIDHYTLPSNIENLYIQSAGASNGKGNTLNNFILGNDYDNLLLGLDGRDQINGRLGNDQLDGGLGNDLLEGAGGNDIVVGSQGNDSVYGNPGDDLLEGGQGNDLLGGGMGHDTLTGGAGKDGFSFANPVSGIDMIQDFVVTDDVIRIAKNGFGGGLTPGILKANQFRIESSAQDNKPSGNGEAVRFIYNKSSGALYFDRDGIGGAAQVQIAKLPTGLGMTHQNFYVYS